MTEFSTEEWRIITLHPSYEVSNLGRVRSLKRKTPYVLKGWIDPAGYHRVTLDSGHVYIHQIVSEMFIGPKPDGHEVDHINELRGDNRAENLRYMTRQENLARREFTQATHCKEGHPFTGSNLYIRPSNGRQECRTCNTKRHSKPRGTKPCTVQPCNRVGDCWVRSETPVCERHYQQLRRRGVKSPVEFAYRKAV